MKTSKKGRQPQQKREDDLNKKMEDDFNNKNGRQPQKIKNGQPQAQFKKSTLIGCDIIVN
jgi:hypothetical protein